jgi:hypothetical protein
MIIIELAIPDSLEPRGIMLKQGYHEEQLQRQLDHFKSNISTFQKCVNYNKRLADGCLWKEETQVEPHDVKYVQMILF